MFCLFGWLDGWMVGWLDGWMDGLMEDLKTPVRARRKRGVVLMFIYLSDQEYLNIDWPVR